MSASLEKLSTLNPAGYRDVPPQALAAVSPQARIIDVREPSEWNGELGHLARAQLVPLATLSTQAMSWDRNGEYVLVCRSGGRSARAAQVMVGLGFRHVYNLVGGMTAQRAAQTPN